jgi:hypothetical protein
MWFAPVPPRRLSASRVADVTSALLVLWIPLCVVLVAVPGPRTGMLYMAGCLLGGVAVEAARTWATARRAASARLVLDEGGLRVQQGGRRVYRRLEDLGYCCLRQTSAGGGESLVVRSREGELAVQLPARAPRVRAHAFAFMRAFNAARTQRNCVVPPGGGRGAEGLEGWLAELEAALARARGAAYRRVGLEHAHLQRTVVDRTCAAEARAAAAFLLVRRGITQPVCRALSSPACPPLLVAFARMAGGCELVDDARLCGALPWLSGEDRAAVVRRVFARRQQVAPPPCRGTRLRDGMGNTLEVQQQAIAWKSLLG